MSFIPAISDKAAPCPLDHVNRLVSSSLNPDEVLQNIVAAAARFFDAPWVSMWVVDEARDRVVRSFVIGDDGRADSLPVEFAMGEGAVGWVAKHREPILWTGAADTRLPDECQCVADNVVGDRHPTHEVLKLKDLVAAEDRRRLLHRRYNQAALLATALPNPSHRNAARPSRRHAGLATRIMSRALTAGPFVKCVE